MKKTAEEQEFEIVSGAETADIIVINTCSVTGVAEKKCRNAISKFHTKNPSAKIIVTGCYAQLQAKLLIGIEGVSLVLGNDEKSKMFEYINNIDNFNKDKYQTTDFKCFKAFNEAYSGNDRTRSFLKIQDGCDYFCSYCSIPLARGLSRSDNTANVIENAKKIVSSGVKEIVLTGINIGDFGRKNGESFYELLVALEKVEGLERLRISSIEPNLLEDRIIEMVSKSKVIMPHFHIPLQCGTDRLLSLMNRKYTTTLFQQKVELVKQLIPDAFIGVDVISGVPTETEEDFAEAYAFINSLNVSQLHVFTYSERPDTKAINMKPIVPVSERKRRTEILQILSDKKTFDFYSRFQGQIRPVLWEDFNSKGMMHGFTDNYVKAEMPYNKSFSNKIFEVKLLSINLNNNFDCELI